MYCKRIVVFLIILVMFFVTGCLFPRNEREEYHEPVEDIERYITDRLDDYIYITGFSEAYVLPSSKLKGKLYTWNITFKNKYINDESKVSNASLSSIIEEVRKLYNEYVSNLADYYLDNCVVEIYFNVRPDNPPSLRYAAISNWDYENWKPSGRELSTVRMFSLNSTNESYSFPFGDWDYYYKNGGIDVAQMDETSTMDQIIEVADNIPDLKYIAVKNQAVADEASKLRPNVKFVGLQE